MVNLEVAFNMKGDFSVNSTQTHTTLVSTAEHSQYPLRRAFQWGYFSIASLFVLCVLFQVFMAGAGILVTGFWLGLHASFGYFIVLIPLLLLLPLSLLGGFPRFINWLNVLLALLALAQPMLLWHLGLPIIAALHPVNALLIFVLPLFLLSRVWGLLNKKQKERDQ